MNITGPSAAANDAATAIKIQQAAAMSLISICVAIPALLASLPVVYVLRKHLKVIWTSCSILNPFQHQQQQRLQRLHHAASEPTESDIVLSIILCLQASDLVFALGFLMTPINDSLFLCSLQGAILQLSGPCAMLFSMCLSIELWIVIKSMLESEKKKQQEVLQSFFFSLCSNQKGSSRRRLNGYIFLTLFVSILFLLLDSFLSGFGRYESTNVKEIAWCWVKNQDELTFFSYYGVATFVLLIVILCYGLVIIQVVRKINQGLRAGTSPLLLKSLRRTFFKVGLYPLLMTLTLLPGLIHRLPSLFNRDVHNGSNSMDLLSSQTLKYIHAGTMPLLGLIDALILASGNAHVRSFILFF